MQQFLPGINANPISSSYSSVFKFGNKPKPLTFLVNRILNNLTASSRTDTCKSDIECPDKDICILGSCVRSLTRYHDAYGNILNLMLGTGIEFDYEKGFWKIEDAEKGTFVESRDAASQIRAYLITSLGMQLVELRFGAVVTGLTGAIIAYWGKIKSNMV
jgi:nicastrin